MTEEEKKKILDEKAEIEKEIYQTRKEIILLSKYRKATEALLDNLEMLYNHQDAAINAMNDDQWAKNNFLDDTK
jgi:predicted nucleic-acid-binding protein